MLLRTYPQFTLEFVRKRLTTAQGFAYYAWAKEHHASVLGEQLERKTPGYIAQEVEKQKGVRHG